MNKHIPRLGRICGYRLRRWIERQPLREAFEAAQRPYSTVHFHIPNKKKFRIAWNSDRIILRRAAGLIARRQWLRRWKNAGQVLSQKMFDSVVSEAQYADTFPLTSGGVIAR